MDTLDFKTSVKLVGSNGQISLGKEFAGRQVLVEERAPGVWLIRTAKVIPETELWLHEPAAKNDLNLALKNARSTAPRESSLDAIFGKSRRAAKPKTKTRQTRSK
jgi:hypothetical protein